MSRVYSTLFCRYLISAKQELGQGMKLLLIVLGVFLVFEGAPWFLSPESTKRILREMQRMPAKSMRLMGFLSMLLGLFLVYLGTG